MVIEFMGHKVDHMQFANIPEHGGSFNTTTVRYDKDWNWLMPVVHKIGTIDVDFEPFANVSVYSSVEEIYNEAVSFIKWYNENK